MLKMYMSRRLSSWSKAAIEGLQTIQNGFITKTRIRAHINISPLNMPGLFFREHSWIILWKINGNVEKCLISPSPWSRSTPTFHGIFLGSSPTPLFWDKVSGAFRIDFKVRLLLLKVILYHYIVFYNQPRYLRSSTVALLTISKVATKLLASMLQKIWNTFNIRLSGQFSMTTDIPHNSQLFVIQVNCYFFFINSTSTLHVYVSGSKEHAGKGSVSIYSSGDWERILPQEK